MACQCRMAWDVAELAEIVRNWAIFDFSAGPDRARLQGEPVDAQSYFRALEFAGDTIQLDLSFLTRTLPQSDVRALIDHHDPCGTIIPLDLGAQLTPTDELSLFGHVASPQQGIDLRRDLILLLPGALNGDALAPTSQAMCNVARQFRDLAGQSPGQPDALHLSMDGVRAELGAPVSSAQAPQFAIARDALPAGGYFWSGVIMRGPEGNLLMLPLSQPSGDVEDLAVLSRNTGDAELIALTRPAEETLAVTWFSILSLRFRSTPPTPTPCSWAWCWIARFPAFRP
jgi:hypothetical protein